MPNTKNKNEYKLTNSTIYLSSTFIFLLLFWAYLNAFKYVDQTPNFIFGFLLAFVPLIGFIGGINSSRRWGLLSSKIGRFLFFTSLGLLFWSLGTFTFSYYNLFLNIEVPFPSIADWFYVSLYLFYTLGALNLMKAAGAKYGLRSLGGKISLILVPLFVFLVSFQIFLGGELPVLESLSAEFLLDIFYPLGDIILLSITILTLLLSFNYLGGRYSYLIYILLLGFSIEYVADMAFTITTYNENFYVASWVDLLFLISTFLVSLVVSLFLPPEYASKK